MADSGNPIFIVLVEADQKFYALSDDGGNIAAYDTEKKALALIEESYNSGHRRGYEASMSATMNWLLFHPKVVPIAGTEDLLERFFLSPQASVIHLGSVAGHMTGLLCDRDVKAIWDAGAAPRLISEDTFPNQIPAGPG